MIEANGTLYLKYPDAVAMHILLMHRRREIRFGVFEPALIKSALARPQHAAIYEAADLPRQAATLCYGLIKNHPWVGGNKRTATFVTERFLHVNGMEVIAPLEEIIALSLAIEADNLSMDEIADWYRQHMKPRKK